MAMVPKLQGFTQVRDYLGHSNIANIKKKILKKDLKVNRKGNR